WHRPVVGAQCAGWVFMRRLLWEGLTFDDYRTLFQKAPHDAVKAHEIFQEYDQKINLSDTALLDEIIQREKEKLVYFILTYGQQTILVKSGEKKAEKAFLGYEFSNRRGSEGIHPIQRGKLIDECTKLYDADSFNNPEKASTYIYDAFAGNYSRNIDESLKENVRCVDLVDMLNFGRLDFDKSMSLAVKKKVKIESRWDLVKLSEVATINPPKKINEYISDDTTVSFIEMASVSNEGVVENKVDRKVKELKKGSYKFFQENDIIIAKITPCMENGKCAIVRELTNGFGFGSSEFHIIRLSDKVLPEYIFSILNTKRIREIAETHMTGASGHRRVPDTFYSNIRIPLPPKDIQEKIVDEVAVLEDQEKKAKESIEEAQNNLNNIVNDFSKFPKINLGDYSENLDYLRKPVTRGDRTEGEYPYYGASGIIDYVNSYVVDDDVLLIAEDGANLKSRKTPIAIPANGKIWVNNHAHILKFNFPQTRTIIEKHLNATDISEFITGQAQPKLNQQNLNRIPVPNIPETEQQNLVKKIEKI
ncbi:MAG: restriction endonuclease subunit S, partial [Candidatus Electrothrix sp. AUS4]|nr:restriction endonuclease subunit S [Candidatus Electrothrix sp. AUS4]